MGTSPSTLLRVAGLAGVSTATVARVLRDDPRVAPETRARVQAVIDQTGYRINAVARGLRRQQTATVGHVINSLTPNPFFVEVALGLQEEASRHGFDVLIYNAQATANGERAGVEAFIGRRVDAIIFTTPHDPDNVRIAHEAGFRVVQVERPTDVPTAAVTVNNYEGAVEATRHLLDLGHERILFLGSDEFPSWEGESVEAERLRGYRDAVRGAGYEPHVLYVRTRAAGNGAFEPARHFMREVLARDGAPPTAIVAYSDMIAASVLQSLHDADLRVPDQVSVVGFDDTLAGHLCPPLTTVALPMRDIGRTAFRLAVDETRTGRRARLDSRLVIRESTAPPT